jgi:hypothetical protein
MNGKKKKKKKKKKNAYKILVGRDNREDQDVGGWTVLLVKYMLER